MYISLWTLGILWLAFIVWSSWPDAEMRAFHRDFRQRRRAQQRQQYRDDWLGPQAIWRTQLWHRGDGRAVCLLLALAVVVIVLCR